MIKYFEEKIKESNKNIFKNEEIEKIKKNIKDNNLSRKEIDSLITNKIKDNLYKENKNKEYIENKELNILEIGHKDDIYNVEVNNERCLIINNKNINQNDFEIAFNKISNVFGFKKNEIKRLKFKGKNSILYPIDYEMKLDSEEEFNNEEKIINCIENQDNKTKYLSILLFCLFTDITNVMFTDLENTILFNVKMNKNSNKININGNIFEKNSLIDCIFKNYYDNISNFIFKNFTKYNLQKIIDIIDLEIDQKESDKFKKIVECNFNKIIFLNDKKVEEIFNSYGINSIDELLNFMKTYFEYGTLIKIDDKFEKIPFGTLESTEGKNNKKITFDNPEIVATVNKYYSSHKTEINPEDINITQLLKNISTISQIIKKEYFVNNPLNTLKYEIGNSLEQMELIALFLKIKNIEFKRYVISEQIDYENSKKLIDCHYFIAAKISDKWCYLENSLYDFRGNFDYTTLDNLLDTVVSKIIYSREKNPYKELENDKYIVNEISKIDSNQDYNRLLTQISKSPRINLKNAIYMYNCENEIRKNILDNKTDAFILNEKPIKLKPSKEIKDNNEYKEEYIKLLAENIMNITYLNKGDGVNFFNVCPTGKQEIMNKEPDEKKSNFILTYIFITIIIICLIIILITKLNNFQ